MNSKRVTGNEEPQYPHSRSVKPGKLPGHRKITNETGKAPSYISKVPKKDFREPGGSFTHKVSLAYEIGGLGYVIRLIVSYILPCVSPPSLYHEGKTNIVEHWTETFSTIKRLPLENNCEILLNFSSKLEKQIQELPSNSEERTELKNLQTRVNQELERRLNALQKTMESQMPLAEWQELARKADITLPEGSFGQKYVFFQKEIEAKKKAASDVVQSHQKALDELKKNAKNLNEELGAIPQGKKDLNENRNRRTNKAIEDGEKEFSEQTNQLDSEIKNLEAAIEALKIEEQRLLDIKKGKVTEGVVWKTVVSFTKEDEEELTNRVQPGLALNEAELSTLKGKLTNIAKEIEEKETKTIKAIDDEFIPQTLRLENREKEIPGLLKQNQIEQDSVLRELERARKKLTDLNGLIISRELFEKGAVEKFVRLTFFDSAFKAFQAQGYPEIKPSAFIKNFRENQKNLEDTIKSSFETRFGLPPPEIKDFISNLAIRNVDNASAERLGLNEFL